VLYELHMRDFSVSDPLVPEQLKGRYGAFALNGTAGTNHLAGAGGRGSHARAPAAHVRHRHDQGAARGSRRARRPGGGPVRCKPGGGRAVPDAQRQDDPAAAGGNHEPGSRLRATAADRRTGWQPGRLQLGLRPVAFRRARRAAMPPTRTASRGSSSSARWSRAWRAWASGPSWTWSTTTPTRAGRAPRSVLDRIVPGYYHRYNERSGAIETSTCCPNTATEFVMMEKLMADTLLRFSRTTRSAASAST
jgi:hypothetical protein